MQRLQGFPEQGWRSAINPCRQKIKSMHLALRLTLDIPEARGLVWVVDSQADGSDVLQSLRREEQSPTSRVTDFLIPSLSPWLEGDKVVPLTQWLTGRRRKKTKPKPTGKRWGGPW